MRVAFAGSPAAAIPPLRALAASRHAPGLVVTQPDRERGRARRTLPTPVALAADELGIPVIRPESINRPEVIARISESGAEALVVAAFGQILRGDVLAAWPCINVHYSLLPAYRGAAPVERALMDGVSRTGVTIMQMDAGLDTGPILAAREMPVEDEDDAGALTARLADLGAELIVPVLDDLESGRLSPVPQPDEGASLAPKIAAEDRRLDTSLPAAALARRVRALSPHIGVTCTIDDAPFRIWSAVAAEASPRPGLRVEDGRLLIGCADGAIEVRELQPPGRSRMAADAFLRGWRGPLALGTGA